MQPKREKLPILPGDIWGQIASHMDYHTWSLFRRSSGTANEIATQPQVVHSVISRFFRSRYKLNISG
jgi:hypothetical protein